MPKQLNIDRFNKLLKQHNQTLQAEKIRNLYETC